MAALGSRARVEHRMKFLQMAEITLVLLEKRMHNIIKEVQIQAVVISPALAKEDTKEASHLKLLKTQI